MDDVRGRKKPGLWAIDLEMVGGFRRFWIRLFRFFSLLLATNKRCRCDLQAASLTFFSLMAMITILAMTLAMARAFGGDELARRKINASIDGWVQEMEAQAVVDDAAAAAESGERRAEGGERRAEGGERKAESGEEKAESGEVRAESGECVVPAADRTQVEQVKEFSAQVRKISNDLMNQLDGISFSTLGGIGAVMLFWTVISTLGKVEQSFNEVWMAKRSRPLIRKASDYLFATLILPFLAIAASTVPIASKVTKALASTVGHEASTWAERLLQSPWFNVGVTVLMASLLFAFLLGYMPYVKVKILPALAGGVFTAVFFLGWFKLCTMLQIGIGKYSVLYGSFAVLPILLAWMCMSWRIIVTGAVVAFSLQCLDDFTAGVDGQPMRRSPLPSGEEF